jgi:hypothetical protein
MKYRVRIDLLDAHFRAVTSRCKPGIQSFESCAALARSPASNQSQRSIVFTAVVDIHDNAGLSKSPVFVDFLLN